MNQPIDRRTSGHFHAVPFYENQESLCRMVGEFLSEGLIAGQPALVIGTPEHREAIVRELNDRNINTQKLEAAGDLFLLDGRETLDAFMVDGHPSEPLFETVMTDTLLRLCGARKDCTVRAYGEMVDLLWKDGKTVAAIQLEMLWNKLAQTHDFSLLCGYGMGNFYKDANVEEICSQHSHVISASGEPAPVNVSRPPVH